MKKFKAGIVGAGFVGRIHSETLRRLGNVEVVALTDIADAEQAARQMNIPAWYSDFKEMLGRERLDVIHICTPNSSHFEIAMAALERGVNVLCEKPMTTSVSEAEALVRKAKETGLTVALNFHNRFYPMTHHMRNIIRDGQLGNVFSITGTYTQDWLLFDTDYSWRLSEEISGKTRVVADIGSHWMDLAEYVSGQKITDVCADFTIIHPVRRKPKKEIKAYSAERFSQDDYENIPVNTEDNASVLFRFSNGAKGSAFFSQVIAGKSVSIDLLVGGYKKSAQWNSESCNKLVIGAKDDCCQTLEKGPTTVHPESVPLVAYPLGHLEGFPDAFKQCFRQVYDSLENPNAPRDFAVAEDGLHEVILCEKIFESAQTQRWVQV